MDLSTLPKEEQCLEWVLSPGPAQLQLHLSSNAGKAPLHCVGSLQVQRQMQLGFLCGSLPVPTDNDAIASRASSASEAAIVPAISVQTERAMAPQYRMLPTQTDLNTLLLSEMEPEQILPIPSAQSPRGVHELCMAWGNGYHTQPLARKCEALAVSALAGYGDEIDVIAPVDILKKIFKIPYSKGRLSVAVHRVGRTLILSTGPDVEEGEKLVTPKKNQAKAMERSLFLKFAMQSVRAEACDCPQTENPQQHTSEDMTSKRSSTEGGRDYVNTSLDQHGHVGWQFMVDHSVDQNRTSGSTKILNTGIGGSSKDKKQRFSWSSSSGSRFSTGIDALKTSSLVGEQQRDPDCRQSDSEHQKRHTSEGFLRVLFWQLQEMRMLLGSDLLLFSDEKHAAVSLHLWEVERQVTPLMWLDAWLDNVMASVPELAICYHHNGIVQGYELLKTDDIFLLKGLSEDGTVFFHPNVVQENALSVLRFLQENCKEDPGTYWLFKNAGEDLVQLFDLSVISKNHTTSTTKDEEQTDLSSPRKRGRGSFCWPLGILLYRLAHRLSLSQDPSDRSKCANFFKKCLEFLGEQEHLFVRASAHEHVARIILRCHQELDSIVTPFLLEFNEHNETVAKSATQPVLEHLASSSVKDTNVDGLLKSTSVTESSSAKLHFFPSGIIEELGSHSTVSPTNVLEGETLVTEAVETENGFVFAHSNCVSSAKEPLEISSNSPDADIGRTFADASSGPLQNMVDPVSARLAAVHHVSQAIKALRWQRQLQDVEGKVLTSDRDMLGTNRYVRFVPVCVCGEIDCIELCDIRECEIGPYMDQKLWQLVLLLGESYLVLGQAYKDDGRLKHALKAIELACSVYDSMPQHWSEKCPPFHQGTEWTQMKTMHSSNPEKAVPVSRRAKGALKTSCQPVFHNSSNGRSIDKALFWGQAWMLLGDIHVEYQRVLDENKVPAEKEASKFDGLTMAQEVVKEVKRLRKKFGQNKKSCSICSLLNCSCQSDRASSGSSASSSSSFGTTLRHARKHCKDQVSSKGLGSRTNCDIPKDNIRVSPDVSDSSSRERNTSLHKQPEEHPVHEDVTADGNSKLGSNIDLSTDVLREKADSIENRNKGDIFSFLQTPISGSMDINLWAAVDCYDAAVLMLREIWQGSEELKSALRKKGWTCNELGRIKLAQGNVKGAETAFDKAISAFKDVEDHTNVVLIYCNIGHGKRASAEALVSQLDAWKDAGLHEHVSKQIFEDAKSYYVEALKLYDTAKEEMKLSCDIDRETIDLHNEVQTQYAHTYLRLGMLLAREDNCGLPHLKSSVDTKQSDSLGSGTVKGQKLFSKMIGMTANDAIREAITLYETLGCYRSQEAAFAQFQLACHHRDRCLQVLKAQRKDHLETNLLQQAKRYLSLAERYWLKALKHYTCTSHPDMFLEILMQRSALYMAMAPLSNSSLMWEMALSHLLEGRQACLTLFGTKNDLCEKEPLKPSNRVVTRLSQQLQTLLRTMLAAAQNLHKTSSDRSVMVQTRNRRVAEGNTSGEMHSSSDVIKLKEMYRLALKSTEAVDLQVMYDMWMS